SDQAEEAPTNFALMDYPSTSSNSEVSTDSKCSSSCMENVKILKEQNEHLLKDLRTSKLNIITYKIDLESVEARLLVYKKNKSVYEEDIKNSSNSLSKLIDCQIVDKYKTDTKPVVETSEVKANADKPKAIRKNNGAAIIKDWVSDRKQLLKKNGVAERKNRTLIEAARTMLADCNLPTTFWTEAVNTACYAFLRPFGSPVTILNTIDHLGKFDGKADEGFFISSKSSPDVGFKPSRDNEKKVTEEPEKEGGDSSKDSESNDQEKEDNVNSTNTVNAASTNEINVVGAKTSIKLPDDPNMPELEDIIYSDDDEDVGVEADMKNLDAFMPIEAMQDELLQFKLQKVWTLVELPNRKRAIGTKWVFRNKKDKRGITIKNKARLVSQGYTQEEGIDYDEMDVKSAFLNVQEIDCGCKFYSKSSKSSPDAGFKPLGDDEKKVTEEPGKVGVNFVGAKTSIKLPDDPNMPELEDIVYSNDDEDVGAKADMNNLDEFISVSPIPTIRVHKDHPVKQIIRDLNLEPQTRRMTKNLGEHDGMSRVLYFMVRIEKEVYVVGHHQEFEDPNSLTEQLVSERKNRQDFIYQKDKGDILLVQVQDKYVTEIFQKFGFTDVKIASTDSDYAGASLDRKSTTGGYQFLGSRLISWQCKKQTVVANSITEAEYVAASSCCGQVLWIQNQLLDYGTMASAIIYIATNQKFNFSKYIFESIVKNFDNAGKFLMYPRKQRPRKPKRKDTEIPQSSGPTDNVADEAINKEMDDSLERATTTATSLDAE
ncbi:retrovirus-related pol polyprotein from transposon TNT 1-94, partial [Tanacetum coccineum]